MKRWIRKSVALVLALMMTVSIVCHEGSGVLEGVYFTAANDQLLDLTADTMPFYSGGQLYIASSFFVGTDLEVRYVRNRSMGLAMLYTTKTDLRFDLVNSTVYDKNGTTYSGRAIEKNGTIFFPVDLVCQVFGLVYTISPTATVPLIRVKNSSVMLSDRRFIDAAMTQMAQRYAAYEKSLEQNNPVEDPVPPSPPPIQAAEGQKVYLILSSGSPEETCAAMDRLGDSKATFLLTVQQMENGDLVRQILGRGHGLALQIRSTTEEEILGELQRGRELVWNASLTLLQLVWYEGSTDIAPLLSQQGCVRVTAEIDRREQPVRSQKRASALLTMVGQYREDVSVFLGVDADNKDGLGYLLTDLQEAQYRLCAWRLTAYLV